MIALHIAQRNLTNRSKPHHPRNGLERTESASRGPERVTHDGESYVSFLLAGTGNLRMVDFQSAEFVNAGRSCFHNSSGYSKDRNERIDEDHV